MDEFVHAVKRRFPKALLQWEDFKKANAFRLLNRYRKAITCFNDDIQGTAAVAVAGMLAGARLTDTWLVEQRVVILGAIANVDSHGMLVDDTPIADEHKRDFAWPAALAEEAGLAAAAHATCSPRSAR